MLPGEQRGYGGAHLAILIWSPREETPNLSVPEEASERKVTGLEGSFRCPKLMCDLGSRMLGTTVLEKLEERGSLDGTLISIAEFWV